MSTQKEGAEMICPSWLTKFTRRPDVSRPYVQATFPKCRCGATQHKANISNQLKTFHDVELYVLAKVTIIVFDFYMLAPQGSPTPFVMCLSAYVPAVCAAGLGARNQRRVRQVQGSRCKTERHTFAVHGDGAWPGHAHRF